MARSTLLLAAVSVLFSLTLAEFVARVRFFGIDAFGYEQVNGFRSLGVSGLIQPATAPDLIFELKPGLDTGFKLAAFKTNSVGLRDGEYPVAKDTNTFRVAVVGDSYTMGAGVPIEEAFHSLIEAKLNADGPLHYEFINFGVGGYSLRQYAAVIRHKVLPLHPDLSLLGWCGENDHEVEPDAWYQQPYQPHPTESGFFTSYLLRWIEWARESRRPRRSEASYSPAQLQNIRSIFERIRDDVGGISVVVVQLGLRERRGDRLRTLATDAGFRFIDTAPAFAGGDLNEYAIHPLDAHPNARANRIYADVVLSALEPMGVGGNRRTPPRDTCVASVGAANVAAPTCPCGMPARSQDRADHRLTGRVGIGAAIARRTVITYLRSPPLTSGTLNELFATAWPAQAARDFAPLLERSLVYIAAFDGTRLVGFVNVAWDGGVHGFVLDTTVHRDHQRRGIGSSLLREAAAAACERGVKWLHVDFEPALEPFYRAAEFAPTSAGLLRLPSQRIS